MRKLFLLMILLFVPLSSARAELAIQREGPQVWPSKHELAAHVGYQTGIGGQIANPPGFKLFLEYGYRFHPNMWFDVQLNQIFGMGGGGVCVERFGGAFNCANAGGSATELAAGIKFRWQIPTAPVVVSVPVDIGVAILYDRACNDGGASPIIRPGTNVHYFITRNIGIGAGFNFALGPGIHGAGRCSAAYTDFYGSFDIQAGASFALN